MHNHTFSAVTEANKEWFLIHYDEKFDLTKTKLLILLASVYTSVFAQIAPNLNLIDMDGVSHNLYDYLDDGKTVLLDFFITNCPPCQESSTYMNEFWKIHGPYGRDEMETLSIEVNPNSNEIVKETALLWGIENPIINLNTIPEAYLPFIHAYPNYLMICPDRSITLLTFGFRHPLSTLEWEQALNTCKYGYDFTDITLFDLEITQCENNVTAQINLGNVGLKPVSNIYIDVFTDNNYKSSIYWDHTLLPTSTSNETPYPILYEDTQIEASEIHFEVKAEKDINPKNNRINHKKKLTYHQDITIELQMDYYPEEISWLLVDADGNIIIEGDGRNYQPYQFIRRELKLDTSICYSFIINDEFGDGFCCSLNGGYYPDGHYLIKAGPDTLIYNNAFKKRKEDAFYIENSMSNEVSLTEINNQKNKITKSKYFNLKGQNIKKPINYGPYLREDTYENGHTKYTKFIEIRSK
ncbi:MAG: hypothetical protein P8I82_01810 [Flavobacteriales bacterium]|nr:hypothetical protein [Flavobacteriales bacterium]